MERGTNELITSPHFFQIFPLFLSLIIALFHFEHESQAAATRQSFFGTVVSINIKETLSKIFKVFFFVINLFFLCSSWDSTYHVVGVHRVKQAYFIYPNLFSLALINHISEAFFTFCQSLSLSNCLFAKQPWISPDEDTGQKCLNVTF